ncbi:MAG TPA: nitroreductase family protein [Polyangiaceae bacterium]
MFDSCSWQQAKPKFNRLEAARLAPSANNRQPWHYIVVKDPAVRQRLRRAYDKEWFYGAPIILCVCGAPSRNPARPEARDYRDIDVSISFDHLILAATAEGLGTCWVGAFDPTVVREELRIPDGLEPIVMTPLGYADEAPAARERRPIASVIHRERW